MSYAMVFIYLYSIADGVAMVAGLCGFTMSSVCSFICLINYMDDHYRYSDEKKLHNVIRRKNLFKVSMLGVALMLFAALIPNKEGMRAMAALYIGNEVLKNEKVIEISGNAVDVLNEWLKKTKTDLTGKEVE